MGLLLAASLLVAGAAWWLLALWPWPFATERASFEERLDASTADLVDYRDRAEVNLRLQMLANAIADGRRAASLRPTYRLLEELLEPVLGRLAPQRRTELLSEFDNLLPDLTQDRAAAMRRIERIREMLQSPAGPGRQGAG
jgi:hypothetical protein